jgi:hypothetical protein
VLAAALPAVLTPPPVADDAPTRVRPETAPPPVRATQPAPEGVAA